MLQRDNPTDLTKQGTTRTSEEQVAHARILLGLNPTDDIIKEIKHLIAMNSTLWGVVETAKKVSQLELTGIRKQLVGILTLKEKK